MNAYPFLLLKRSTVEWLAQRANAALARWAAEWAMPSDGAVACTAADDKAQTLGTASDWRHCACANGASAWLHVQVGLERCFEQMLFKLNDMSAAGDKHVSSSIATDVAEDALQDLVAILISEVTGQASQVAQAMPSASVPERLFRPGSGAVMCAVRLGDKAITLLLPAELIAAPPASHKPSARPPLTTLRHALTKLPVHLSVEVGRTELTLGYLRTLAVGDVLALPTSVDHTMRVAGPGDTTVCHAHLGSLAGYHAVELIKPARQHVSAPQD